MIFYGYLIAFLYAIVCVLVAFCLNKLGVCKKYTRKIVHISIGLEWFILYHFMGASFHFLTVCLVCLALLFIDYRANIISALSSDGDNAPGTVYYGASMSIMAAVSLVLPDMMLPFGVGVVVTSLGDGMAGVLGQLLKRGNRRIYGNKTLVGSLTFIISSFVGILLFNLAYGLELEVWQIVLISVFAAALEVISIRGLDNITITVGSSLLTYGLLYFDGMANYLVPILLTPIIIAVVLTKRVLTPSAVALAVALDLLVSVAFGNGGFLVLLTFLALSVATDKVKAAYKKKMGIAHSKSDSSRGAKQVIANGAVGAICASLFIITRSHIFTAMYIASVAEAFADTIASGIGVLSQGTFDVFRMRKCEKGISGGMSIIGTASSLLGAVLISALALLFDMTDPITALFIALSAFLGMIFDSLLGSLLQVKYRCPLCGKITEEKRHCGTGTLKHSGVSFINNDAVNIIANSFTALLLLIILL